MIEELTPRLLSVLVFLVVATAPVLTLLLSAMLLRRYRRTVTEQMALTGGFDGPATDLLIPDRPSCDGNRSERAEGATRYRLAVNGPRQEALRYIGAGLAFAIVFALAARFVYPFRLGLPGFLISVYQCFYFFAQYVV